MSTKLTDGNPLSAREMEVAQLLVTGASNAEIARELTISPQTVKVHVRNLYEKLDVSSRTEATLLLLQRRWLDIPELDLPDLPTSQQEPAPPLPEPAPLADRRSQPQLWQKLYLLGAALLCLLLLWVPNRFDQPESDQIGLLTDSTSLTIGQPDVEMSSRWIFRVPMPLARSRLTVASQGEWIYALGGEDEDGRPIQTANAYNINVNEWQPISPLPIPLSNAASATFQNRLYIAGGNSNVLIREDEEEQSGESREDVPLRNSSQNIAESVISDRLWIYDLETKLWYPETISMPNPLTGSVLVAAEDAIYLIGGWDGETMRDEIWRLVPTSDDRVDIDLPARWELVTRLDVPRAFLGATEVEGEIYVVGGYDGQKELVLADVYTLAADRWRSLPNLAFPRGGLSLVADDLAVFALGGGWITPINNHERFDLSTGDWTNFRSPVQGSWRHLGAASTEGDGYLHLIGGWGGDYMDLHLRYQSSFRSLLPVINN